MRGEMMMTGKRRNVGNRAAFLQSSQAGTQTHSRTKRGQSVGSESKDLVMRGDGVLAGTTADSERTAAITSTLGQGVATKEIYHSCEPLTIS